MIRNVVMGRITPGSEVQVEAGMAGIAALRLPGMLANHAGRDLALREGGWDFAITNDWVDADAYRAYDLDEEHNRYRAQVVAGLEAVARVQFEVPDGDEAA